MTPTAPDVVASIIEKLKTFGCRTLLIAHRERSPQDGHDIDDPTYSHAVIATNTEATHDHLDDWYGWQDENDIDILLFDAEGCANGVETLGQEFVGRDGARVVYRGETEAS